MEQTQHGNLFTEWRCGKKIKRAEGGAAGRIGTFSAFKYNEGRKDSPLSICLQTYDAMFDSLLTAMERITPEAKGRPEELNNLTKELDSNNLSMKMAMLIPDYKVDSIMKNAKQSDLVKCRTLVTDTINNLNTLLYKYYQNDARIQKKVLPLINALNNAVWYIDFTYRNTQDKDLAAEDEDLGDLKSDYSEKKYEFNVNGAKIRMTPSEYEAWLQVYKTPKAVMKNAVYNARLRKAKLDGQRLTAEEEKDLANFIRIKDLARDFEKSHKYMMEKEDFNQQDVDYAFSLEKKERAGNMDSEMLEKQDEDDPSMSAMNNPNASASGTYQMMIMKSVFGGMKGRFRQKYSVHADTDEAINWISDDAANCDKNHKREMTIIIRGLKHTTENPKKDSLQAGFKQLLTRWIFQLFREENIKEIYNKMVNIVTDENGGTMQETDKIITEVLKEK